MTVGFIASRLTKTTKVTIKDNETKKTVWKGEAAEAVNFACVVADWNFSRGHIIYIEN